jgi:hypothetical protein
MKKIKKENYTVRLTDGTTGEIKFVQEVVVGTIYDVHSTDENGVPVLITGRAVEILEEGKLY